MCVCVCVRVCVCACVVPRQAVNDNKVMLGRLVSHAKQLAEEVNGARASINKLKSSIEAHRMERALSSVADQVSVTAEALAALPPDPVEEELKAGDRVRVGTRLPFPGPLRRELRPPPRLTTRQDYPLPLALWLYPPPAPLHTLVCPLSATYTCTRVTGLPHSGLVPFSSCVCVG